MLVAGRITAVRRSHRHYPFEAVAVGLFAVDIKKWLIDAQLVAGRAGDRVLANPGNIVCPEDKNISVMRLNKVVTALIDKHLVPCVDGASGDNFATMKKPAGKNVEVLAERVGRGVYEKALPLTHQSRKSEKEGY